MMLVARRTNRVGEAGGGLAEAKGDDAVVAAGADVEGGENKRITTSRLVTCDEDGEGCLEIVVGGLEAAAGGDGTNPGKLGVAAGGITFLATAPSDSCFSPDEPERAPESWMVTLCTPGITKAGSGRTDVFGESSGAVLAASVPEAGGTMQREAESSAESEVEAAAVGRALASPSFTDAEKTAGGRFDARRGRDRMTKPEDDGRTACKGFS